MIVAPAGASDEDAYSALSGGPEPDQAGAEQLTSPTLRGPPGRSLSGEGVASMSLGIGSCWLPWVPGLATQNCLEETQPTPLGCCYYEQQDCGGVRHHHTGRLRALPATLGMVTPMQSWVRRWAVNPFASGTGDARAAGGGLALYSEAPSAELYLPPPPNDAEVADAEAVEGLSPPEGTSPQSKTSEYSHAKGAHAGAADSWQISSMQQPSGSLLGRSLASDGTGFYSHTGWQSQGSSVADGASPVRQLRSPYRT